MRHLLKSTTALTPAEQLNPENPSSATKRSRLSQLSHEELQNMLWENTFFMTRTYNNAECSDLTMGRTCSRQFDMTLSAYIVAVEELEPGACRKLCTYPSSPAGFLHIDPQHQHTHTHIYTQLLWTEK